MATKKNENVAIVIPAIDVREAQIKVVGTTSLIVHAWSEKAKREMLEKQMKKAKTKGHDAKDPVVDFIDSLYWLEGKPEEKTKAAFDKALQNGARFGFKSDAFKASAVAAAYRSKITKDMVSMRGAFHIPGEFTEIHGKPTMHEETVRVANGVADIRYRGEFKEWYAVVSVIYNAAVISLEQLVNMFNLGGFACGLGEWRPEKGGQHGMYHVE